MTGLDRYYSFGVKENWLRVYFDYEGSANFGTQTEMEKFQTKRRTLS